LIQKKAGFYSRYIDASICPHPLDEEEKFIAFLMNLAAEQETPPVLFITSDEYLLPVSRHRKELERYCLMNIPDPVLLECITDKFRQYRLAEDAGIPVPRTMIASDMGQLSAVTDRIPFPVFIKGAEVTSWRKKMGVAFKGFVAGNEEELRSTSKAIFEQGESGLIQEIIPGPDTSHYKVSCYVSRNGEVCLAFGLRKIRQQPVGFGFGCLVQSIHYPELLDLGRSLFTRIGYRGVGSAEFKLDQRDGKFKLIELNPRYWQQNALAEKCGMNFPLFEYRELTGGEPRGSHEYRSGIKWVNIFSDIESFREIRKRGRFSIMQWATSLKGEKVYSVMARDDVLPGLHDIFLENLLRRARDYGRKLMHSRRQGGRPFPGMPKRFS